jgi:hypothetical protein
MEGKPIQALVHDNDSLCELWHRRLGHLHYKVLSILRGIVTSFPEFKCNIPTIIPSLINAYVDIMCGYAKAM